MHQASRTVVRATTASCAALAIIGCCCNHGHHGHDGPGLGVLNDPRFRSNVLLPINTHTDSFTCENTRFTYQNGKEPLCAVAQWAAGGAPNGTCTIIGLKAGCDCYEGQAHACHEVTQGTCQTGAPNCGVRACLVDSDNQSHWSACSLL